MVMKIVSLALSIMYVDMKILSKEIKMISLALRTNLKANTTLLKGVVIMFMETKMLL